jgi:hypothetical protein
MLVVDPGSLPAMKPLMFLITAIAVGLMLILWSARRQQARNKEHDAVEYYGSWDGYGLPLHLSQKITKQEADARAARGSAYLIGYFDSDGKLVRDVKMYRGGVFFEHEYTYYPSGKLKGMKVTNTGGAVILREYTESDRPTFTW